MLVRLSKKFCSSVGLVAVFWTLFAASAPAQQKSLDDRLSPQLTRKLNSLPGEQKIDVIITTMGATVPARLKDIATNIQKLRVGHNKNFLRVTLPVSALSLQIRNIPEIVFVEDATRKPREELLIANLDKSLNKVNIIQSQFPKWNGDSVTVSVKEDKPDTADIDFKNRFLTTNLSSPSTSSHATIMATMIAGAGNSWHLGKGVAWGSTISSSDFSTLLPDEDTAYQHYQISVQNHSYGVGIENYYGADAAVYDANAIENPSLVHVFSAGNSGSLASAEGTYSGITGFANLTGSFKMAKNVLTVGATDSFNIVASLSSKGPAYDGRVKPELVAYGEDGSSGAAALVSGVALVLQQQYKVSHGTLPPNALVRVILINSADNTGHGGLSYKSGYGSLNALKAVRTIEAGRYMSGIVTNGETRQYSIVVPDGLKKLKIALVWNDPPAEPNAKKALVNDLDMELVNMQTNETWKPWVLNSFPDADSLQQPPTRKRDSLNNIEQVTINNPAAGNYQINITGFSVTGDSQDFDIAFQFDSTDIFEWQFPTRNDFIFTSSVNTIRWSSSYKSDIGILEYSVNNGNTWNLINNAVALAVGYYQWQTPGTIDNAVLRMTIGNNQFLSDTFTVSQRIQTGVGFNCADSFLIYWDKLPATDSYRVYTVGEKYLEPLMTTTDDFTVFAKNTHSSLFYAIAPVIGSMEGVKSYTFNYTTQGVECYIRTFFALLENNIVQLQLILGTLYHINTVILEKYNGSTYIPIDQLMSINNPEISFTDSSPKNGINSYRIKLVLSDGRAIYSNIETVYFFPVAAYIVYPNPVRQSQSLTILTEDTFADLTLQVLNSIGQKSGDFRIRNTVTTIAITKFAKGLYFFRFIKDGATAKVIKVIIQ